MNKSRFAKRIVSLAMTLVMMSSLSLCMAETPSAGRWVLVDVIDGENIKSWDSQNNGSTSFRFDHTYARGSYSVTTTYLGDTDNYYNPPQKKRRSLWVSSHHEHAPGGLQCGRHDRYPCLRFTHTGYPVLFWWWRRRTSLLGRVQHNKSIRQRIL